MLQLGQPSAEHDGARLFEGAGMTLGVVTQGDGIDARVGQFAGMAQQPMLEAVAAHFRVKLQTQHVLPASEGLLAA